MRVVIQENYEKMCKWAADYIAAKINAHGADRPFVLGLPTGSSPLGMGGIGVDGHLAFNEPFTSLTSRTGVRALTTDTRIVNSRFFGNDPEAVPAKALSVGIGTVMDSREVLVLINGHNKARAMAATVEGGVSQKWTCSALQLHPAAIIACDEAACGELKVDTYRYFLDIEKDERL